MDVEIPVGEAVRSGRRQCGIQEMREVMSEVLGLRLWMGATLADLVYCEEVEHDRTGRAIGFRPDFELRTRLFGASQGGIVGQMTVGMFADWVEFNLDTIRKSLLQEQPGCDWQLVAAVVDQVNLRRATQVNYTGKRTGEKGALRSLADHDENDTTTVFPINRQTAYEEQPDYRWQVQTVWADVAHGELVDPQVALGAHPGPMTKYIESGRQLRFLTEGDRKVRQKCERLIREYRERVEAAKKRQAEASERSESFVPVAHAAPEFTDAQIDAAFKLRLDGMNVHLIAQAMGLDAVKLEAVLDKKLEAHMQDGSVSDSARLAEHVEKVLPEKPQSSRRKT